MGQTARTPEEEVCTEDLAGVLWPLLQQQVRGYWGVHLSITDELDSPAVGKAAWRPQ